jgi:hypothetical protein
MLCFVYALFFGAHGVVLKAGTLRPFLFWLQRGANEASRTCAKLEFLFIIFSNGADINNASPLLKIHSYLNLFLMN